MLRVSGSQLLHQLFKAQFAAKTQPISKKNNKNLINLR